MRKRLLFILLICIFSCGNVWQKTITLKGEFSSGLVSYENKEVLIYFDKSKVTKILHKKIKCSLSVKEKETLVALTLLLQSPKANLKFYDPLFYTSVNNQRLSFNMVFSDWLVRELLLNKHARIYYKKGKVNIEKISFGKYKGKFGNYSECFTLNDSVCFFYGKLSLGE